MQVFLGSSSKVFYMLASGCKKVLKKAKWQPGCSANDRASKTSRGSKWSCTKMNELKVFLYYALTAALRGSFSIKLALIDPTSAYYLGGISISYIISVLYLILLLQNSTLRPYLTYFSMRTPGINPLVFSTTKTLLSLETFAI